MDVLLLGRLEVLHGYGIEGSGYLTNVVSNGVYQNELLDAFGD